MLIEAKNLVAVFDLDDTLYRESDYRKSGFLYVCNLLNSLYGVKLDAEKILQETDADILGRICSEAGVPESSKESLLWAYRLHQPDIKLDPATEDVVKELTLRCKQVAILTDGRSVTQRLKLKALGLGNIPVYISEEHDSVKPCPRRFMKIGSDYPGANYLYIADNPRKDFSAPRQLGWKTIGLLGTGGNIHSQDVEGLPLEFCPDLWIENLDQILELLC